MNTPDKMNAEPVQPVFAYIGVGLSFAFLTVGPVLYFTRLLHENLFIPGLLGFFGLTIMPPCLKLAKFPFHFSTAFILFLAASAIVALNFLAASPGEHGFPWPFPGCDPSSTPAVLAIWQDSLLAIEVLYVLAIACEWRIARKH